MSRYKLKCGGKKRAKALFGSDIAAAGITAAATLAAAGMQVKASIDAANKQASSMVENAKMQAKSIEEQTANNEKLEEDKIDTIKSENQANRDIAKENQMTLQMLAGQQNMTERQESMKQQVKFGGRPKRRKLKSTPFYGGANLPFKVTDGGGVLPLNIDNNGYGLYEIIGNDHEHYHKTKGGKNKTGVGFRFNDGSEVEGEGNQNTNQGELLYVTPNDAMFISKHSINGFNPTQAVLTGMTPEQAFTIQENIKDVKGLNDNGSKIKYKNKRQLEKCGGRKKAQTGIGYGYAHQGGQSNIRNVWENPNVGITDPIPTPTNSPIPTSTKTSSFRNFLSNYGGAIIGGASNLIGAGIGIIGNNIASGKINNANRESASIIADAYSKMTGIDENIISEEDYSAPHAMAIVRSADTNINPQLERIRRNAAAETREINRGTLSSAAKQQRLAGVNDRMLQRMGEQYAYAHNINENIRQGNIARIQQVSEENANRDIQARRDYTNAKLSLKQYNNDIRNQKLAGIAQAYADSSMSQAQTAAQTAQANMSSISGALSGTAQGFVNYYDALNNYDKNLDMVLLGADTENVVNFAIHQASRGDKRRAKELYDAYSKSDNPTFKGYAKRLESYV